jgi:hypothetical protein
MIALVLAAGLATSDPADLLRGPHPCDRGMLHTSADPALLMRPQDWTAARPRRLGELPPARAEYAVMRRVNGCMVAAPVTFRLKPIQ